MSLAPRTRAVLAQIIGCGCGALTSVVAAGCTGGTTAELPRRSAAEPGVGGVDEAAKFPTTTPIKHVVVIFGENISFDHYFGTYPQAENRPGEPIFQPVAGTPSPNNLRTPLDPMNAFASVTGVNLLGANPNFTNVDNFPDAANPRRLGPAQARTQGMLHFYTAEQRAAHAGAMDLFPKFTGSPGGPLPDLPEAESRGLVMAYFDGNTVSALWNFAQDFAMNDNSWTSMFGPSTPGAINLISGQTNGFDEVNGDVSTYSSGDVTPDGNGGFTLIGDPDPLGDTCSMSGAQVSLKGRNIGDLLNAQGITWGWFEGGFDPSITNADGSKECWRANGSLDYIPHHQPFQYYESTANPSHARPSSTSAIGWTFERDGSTRDPANHQYDSRDFFRALKAGNFPAVSYLKAAAFEDGHAGYSNPLDEQNFIVEVVAAVQATPEWSSTAIILAYDDSDGWYDHQAPPIVNPSNGAADELNGHGFCNDAGAQQRGPVPLTPLHGHDEKPALGRCGYGTRLPLLVVSPFAKKNYIDHTLTDQTSILRFIEDNWLGGERIQPGGSFDTIAGTIENMFQF